MQLQNKIALVTGASRGIGFAIAKTLAEQGAQVFATATSIEGVEKMTQNFSSIGLNIIGKVLNVNNHSQCEKLLEGIKQEAGPVEILVNNAGITQDNLLLRMKDEEWNKVIETNLTAVFRLSKLCMRDMIKAKQGRIINISSIVAVAGNAGQANYCAAKAGLIGFSKSLAQEIASRNITVNVVAPGLIETDMTTKLTDAQREAILKTIPLARMGKAEDVAAMVAFLASEKANYITGQTIHINGGMLMP